MTLTVLDAINKFLYEFSEEKFTNSFVIGKTTNYVIDEYPNVDEYLVSLDTDPHTFREKGEDMINTIIKALRKAGISDDIIATKSDKIVFKKLAELLEDYYPRLAFKIKPDAYDRKFSIQFNMSCFVSDDYGQIDFTSDTDIEEAIIESICSARAELAVLVDKSKLNRIANYIKYQNRKSKYNDAVVIIENENKNKNKNFSVVSFVNNVINLNRKNFDLEEVRQSGDSMCRVLDDFLDLIIKKTPKLEKYVSKYKNHDDIDDCLLQDVLMMFLKLENENLILRMSQNINSGTSIPKDFFKVQLKDTSNNDLLAESYDKNLRKAVIDVIKKMIRKDAFHL